MAEHKTSEETKEQEVKSETEDTKVDEVKQTDPAAAREIEEPEVDQAAIKKMKRGELNELAASYGLNPDDYGRADELRSAVFDYLKKQEQAAKKAAKTEPNEETEEEAGKEEKTPKQKPNPPRQRIDRRSKRYKKAHELIDQEKHYSLDEATELMPKTSTVNFDAAVELHMNLGVDPKQADQLVRGTVSLPNGSGKTQRVAAIVPEGDKAAVKKAGADVAGQEVYDMIEKGEFSFDILVAHPDSMKDLSKYAKTLGPQGLMPSPKAGTVTSDVAGTVKELKAGLIEFRVDRYGVVHQMVGRVSFEPKQLAENVRALVSSILQQKPTTLKGSYLKKATLTTTMGPSIKLDISTLT